ncbi:hypothetical protein FIBSPDRAFT_903791 [Athelia psychrophila]|uniref:Uncharacterized protein n=1 Tax=Athelia psychrophila TaxID=1759441 RepID=A0A167VIZ2_9AGAM|nr:hypothetical protein FIBSPDRAFT_903791 [Fibularhizoctonia sp. CBS 109695]
MPRRSSTLCIALAAAQPLLPLYRQHYPLTWRPPRVSPSHIECQHSVHGRGTALSPRRPLHRPSPSPPRPHSKPPSGLRRLRNHSSRLSTTYVSILPIGSVITQAHIVQASCSWCSATAVRGLRNGDRSTKFVAEMRKPMNFWKGMVCTQVLITLVYMVLRIVVYSYQGQFIGNPENQGISSYAWQTTTNIISLTAGLITAALYSNIGVKVIYKKIPGHLVARVRNKFTQNACQREMSDPSRPLALRRLTATAGVPTGFCMKRLTAVAATGYGSSSGCGIYGMAFEAVAQLNRLTNLNHIGCLPSWWLQAIA